MNSGLIFALAATATLLALTKAEMSLQTRRDRGFPIPNGKLGDAAKSMKPKFWSTAAEGRLPASIIPSHYDLTITPIIENTEPPFPGDVGTAAGSVRIRVTCMQTTNMVTLHVNAALVTVSEASVEIKNVETDQVIPVTAHGYDPAFNFYTVTLGADLLAGQTYDISIDFVTVIAKDRYDGLYLTQYTTPGEAEPSYIAVTTFAASAARQAFPCFDEPALKATFEITIGRTVEYVAVSNAELVSSAQLVPGWWYDKFNTTVKMSTYLAIVFVAKYGYKEAEFPLPGGKPVKVYAPPYMIEAHGADYAASNSQKVMEFFEEYFGIEYKLNKYDSAAIPDFQFGAMENFGLVTYKTPFLMYFEGETTETERKRISSIISHESSHMWFGNLITARWWNHIWLNEGFASYMAPIGVKHTDPEFEPEKAFLNDIFQYSMPFDSDPNYAHPILSSDAITAPMYDRINYEKGACMIRMMEGFLTASTLKIGLQKFLAKWQFQAVQQNDLFLVLTEQAHLDEVLSPDVTVQDIMDTWTKQPGFPLVTVSSAGPNAVYISQERFVPLTLSPEDVQDLNPDHLWTIPISMASKSRPNFANLVPEFWLNKDVQVTSTAHNTSEWIMLNLDGTGYYRVLYDYPLINHIVEQLQADLNVISPLSRSQLIDDYFKSAFLSRVNIETALELTKYLGNEPDSHVWDAVLTNLEEMYRMFLGHEGFAPFRVHFVPKLEAAIDAIGIIQNPSDKGNLVLYRLQLIDWACGMDSTTCVNYAKELFGRWQADPADNTIIPLDLQPVIYCTAVANDLPTTNVFDFVLARYGNVATLPHQKPYLLIALACSRETSHLTKLLEEIIAVVPTPVFPDADSRMLLQRITSNSQGRTLVLNLMRENLPDLLNRFDVNLIAETMSTMAQYTNTALELSDIQNFVNENRAQLGPVLAQLEKSMSTMQLNIGWMSKFASRSKNWFEGARN